MHARRCSAAQLAKEPLTRPRLQDATLRGEEELQGQVQEVQGSVSSLSRGLANMEQCFLENQHYANEGIFMLCRSAPAASRPGPRLPLHPAPCRAQRCRPSVPPAALPTPARACCGTS